MIEPEDFIFTDAATHSSKIATPEAALHSIVSKLKGLESAPVIGAFDANHLQQIHARIFQDAFPQAGLLRVPRPSALSSSLDNLFDRLAGEDRLKGLELDAWSKRATDYLREIDVMNPFDQGSDVASTELFRELASENRFALRWRTTLDEFSDSDLQIQAQTLQSQNLRRLLILAVDPDLSKGKSAPGREHQNSLEFVPFL